MYNMQHINKLWLWGVSQESGILVKHRVVFEDVPPLLLDLFHPPVLLSFDSSENICRKYFSNRIWTSVILTASCPCRSLGIHRTARRRWIIVSRSCSCKDVVFHFVIMLLVTDRQSLFSKHRIEAHQKDHVAGENSDDANNEDNNDFQKNGVSWLVPAITVSQESIHVRFVDKVIDLIFHDVIWLAKRVG